MNFDKKKVNFIMKALKKAKTIEYYRNSFTVEELAFLEEKGINYYFSTKEMPHLLIEGFYNVETVVLEWGE